MLELRNVVVKYGQRPVIQGVSLSVEAGEIVALVGPNGAGKSTLIRAVSGVLPCASGQVWVQGAEYTHLPAEKRARQMAVVPQARNLPEGFTARETVLLGRTPYLGWLGKPGAQDLELVAWALERTDTLDLADRPIGQLSGGEQQRVLLARALAQDTPILLLDEPTAHLDLRYQASLLSLIHTLAQERRLSVLMALHDLNLAAIFAQRIALLVEGSLQALGEPGEVLTAEHLQQAFHVTLQVTTHPDYHTPLVLPDGWL